MLQNLIGTLIFVTSAPAMARPQLLSADFAEVICEGWNQTSLPQDLGRSGSGWIDSAGSRGSQRIVVNRRDCSDWSPVQLTIEVDGSGNAICTGAGAHSGGVSYQWKFEPTTLQWADFTDGFGVTKMPGIMNGFVGPYTTAMNNIGNFKTFFAMVGYTALHNNANWACEGADTRKVVREVADIDREDMRETLSGMEILD